MFEYLSRREFIKLGLNVGAGLSLSPVMSGCSTFSESREEVAEIQWDANPVIPVPRDGCYTGFRIKNPDVPIQTQKPENIEQKFESRWFEQYTGNVPAVYCPIIEANGDAQFPISTCENLYRMGIIPLIRYNLNPDWNNVVFGKYDQAIEQFASEAGQFGKPFFITPWPEFNIEAGDKNVAPLPGRHSTNFIQAWIHVHDIFKRKKANNYAVWGLHLTAFTDRYRFYSWDIAGEFFDWIGFSIYNMVKSTGKNHSFDKLFDDAYEWARKSHRAKPIALFELGTSNTSSQAKWIEKAYNKIAKNYPAVKLAVYGFEERHIDGRPEIDSSHLNAEAKLALQEILSDSYFVGSNSEYFKQTLLNTHKSE